MPSAEEFDEFYVNSRRRLVLQTFALTGDLGAARVAVRDGYVAARHHWVKVGRLADPEAWVRPRAWSTAQRRHTVRPWHRERSVSAEQAQVLEALQKLPDDQRRALILSHLASIAPGEIGREIGLTQERTEEALLAGTGALALALECDPNALRARLESLDAAAGTVKLPRAPIIRRSGARRRRNHALIGSVSVIGLVVGAGAFVATAAPPKPAPKVTTLVAQSMLLTPEQLAPVATKVAWTAAGTSDNTAGTGINTTCQGSRFADDNGLGTWVRKFSASGSPRRGLVQTVEISNSPGAAKAAYDTTLGWYAGCQEARLQLVDAFTVAGVGDQAQILRLRIPAAQDRAIVVGIARTGALTTSTVLETQTTAPADAKALAGVLASSVRDLCGSPVAGGCVTTVTTQASMPPPSGETAGMLAVADLPAIAKVDKPWAGTSAQTASVNAAATTCDHADFTAGGAQRPLSRTFLIPQANLPQRFGLTETIGRFASAKAAAQFADQVVTLMKRCPKKELGSTISNTAVEAQGYRGSTYAMWRLENQVRPHGLIAFWTGIIRVGPYVAQVTLTPVQQYDVSKSTFQALVSRARDRLFEVSG